jgi:hypothetical protein
VKTFFKSFTEDGGNIDSVANIVKTAQYDANTNTVAKKVEAADNIIKNYDGTKACSAITGGTMMKLCANDWNVATFLNAIYGAGKGSKVKIEDATKISDAVAMYVGTDNPKDVATAVEAFTKAGSGIGILAKFLGLTNKAGVGTDQVLFTADGNYDGITPGNNDKVFTALADSAKKKAIATYLSGSFAKTVAGSTPAKGGDVTVKGDIISTLFTQAQGVLKAAKTINLGDQPVLFLTDPMAKVLLTMNDEELKKFNALEAKAGVAQTDKISAVKKKIDGYVKGDLEKLVKGFCPKVTDVSKMNADAFKACFAEQIKDHGFINALLKSIPNAGKGVLKVASSAFSGPDAITTEDNLKLLNAYAKVITTVCGADPFQIKSELPEDTDTHHAVTSNRVEKCLEQANKVAYAILSVTECGKDELDSGSVKAACYKGFADKAGVLYNGGDFDKMDIDLSGKYPYNEALPDLTHVEL